MPALEHALVTADGKTAPDKDGAAIKKHIRSDNIFLTFIFLF
jgi:hypothetical protein